MTDKKKAPLVSYEEISRDLPRDNYSALRSAIGKAQRLIAVDK